MESEKRPKQSLLENLAGNGPNYNFYQAVYLANKIIKKTIDESGTDPNLEKLNFFPNEKYHYPATDINRIEYDKNKGNFTFVLNFLGLYGIDSPLPRCYHEQVFIQRF